MKSVLLMTLLLFTATASAQELKGFKCEVLLVAKDLEKGTVWGPSFNAPVRDGGHGGGIEEFAIHAHKVTVTADGKWRGISWRRGNQLIAETVSATAGIFDGSMTTMLHNPKDTEEYTALVCNPLH